MAKIADSEVQPIRLANSTESVGFNSKNGQFLIVMYVYVHNRGIGQNLVELARDPLSRANISENNKICTFSRLS